MQIRRVALKPSESAKRRKKAIAGDAKKKSADEEKGRGTNKKGLKEPNVKGGGMRRKNEKEDG